MKNYRALKIKVFTSDCSDWETFGFEPPPGKLWFEEDLAQVMSQFVWNLKEQFPGNDFQVTRKGPGRYNIVPFVIQQAADSAEEPTCQPMQ